VARTGEKRILEGKRPYGRPRHRWKGNIEIDLKEIIQNYVDWINFTQG
jgi:hypothetical protein